MAMTHDSLMKRKAIAMISPERRKAWAREHPLQSDCTTCLKYRKVSRTCFYPSHFWGTRLDAAFQALCGGRFTTDGATGSGTDATASVKVNEDFNARFDAENSAAATDTEDEVTEVEAMEDTADKGAVSKDSAIDLADALRAAMKATAPTLDARAVKAIVKDMLDKAQGDAVKRLEVTVNRDGAKTTTDVGPAHALFPRLLKMVSAGVNVWIAGPAGSGKTYAVSQVARALGLPFYFNGAIDTEYKLSGFVDAGGRIVDTPFRRAFTEGGVYLFDEIDASMPAALLAFNAALSNGACDFPGSAQPIVRHKDFRAVAGANTFGQGATVEYVGRAKIDAAFLDRFSFLAWGYDEKLEREVSLDPEWTAYVQKLRDRAKSRGLKVVISPRASIRGGELLASGMSRDEVIEVEIKSRIGAETFATLER